MGVFLKGGQVYPVPLPCICGALVGVSTLCSWWLVVMVCWCLGNEVSGGLV